MMVTVVLLVLVTVATVTDVRWRSIYNWTTYPGLLIALAGSVVATACGIDATQGTAEQARWLGLIHLQDCLGGLLACGGVMLVCYVFFPGQVGGGDIKLIAMMGAFLGIWSGLEVMLWTFVLGACLALVMLVWQQGIGNLLAHWSRYAWHKLRLGSAFGLSEEERLPRGPELFLSPSALLALLIVRFELVAGV